jgi:signal transduction histidine kinase
MYSWLTTSNSGILGSIEFLQDTAVDPFQASMITTVETCGKTLLDTVNSVLEFSKLSKGSVKVDLRRLGGKETSTLAHVENIDLATTIEEVV